MNVHLHHFQTSQPISFPVLFPRHCAPSTRNKGRSRSSEPIEFLLYPTLLCHLLHPILGPELAFATSLFSFLTTSGTDLQRGASNGTGLMSERVNRLSELVSASKPLSNGRSVWLLGERTRQVYVVLFRGSGTEADTGHA